MVKAFVKMPTDSLPPGSIDRFMAVEAQALPKDLRRPFEAKKLELQSLRDIALAKKRGFVRMPEKDCAIPKERENREIDLLLLAGFLPIDEDEESFLMDKTKCTEHDLMCEFSLLIALEKKGKKTYRRYFLHSKDPLMAYVGEYRASGKVGGSTNFFGRVPPNCVH